MYRYELKYFINSHQKSMMVHKLRHLCERDPFSDAEGGYLVSSLYFDDYNQSAFFDKLDGVRDRKKYRVRVYNHRPNTIKLERKIKRVNVTDKTHVQISREEYDTLVRGNVGFLRDREDLLAKEFYLTYRTKNLRPRVVVEYRREAYIYKYGDVRITFDSSLKAGLNQRDLFSNGYRITVTPPDQTILEVKYTGYLPDVVRNLLRIESLQWQSISKYANCCAVGM